jgi:hypothetical protein
MKYNKITAIETIKKQLLLSFFGLFAGLVFSFILKNMIIFIPFMFYYIIIISNIFFSNDFEIFEDGFFIIGINRKIQYKNMDIKNIHLEIYGKAMNYHMYINKKKYYINISDRNKNNLIKYFSETDFNGKEYFIDKIKNKTIYY